MGVSMCAFLPGLAAATTIPTVQIDDLTNTIGVTVQNLMLTGSLNIQETDEGVGVAGNMNIQLNGFNSSDPNAPGNGIVIIKNYNIYDPNGTFSDTLSITITGLTPIAGVSIKPVNVDINFLSDTADELVLFSALAGGTSMTETGLYQPVSSLSDLSIQFRSDVSDTPLPAALPLFASGLGALGLLGWSRKRKAQLAA